MGKIIIDPYAGRGAAQFHAATHAAKSAQCHSRTLRWYSGVARGSDCRQCIVNVVATDQRPADHGARQAIFKYFEG